MNGAQALIHTLVREGVEVCFANPGTSEMHFVAALDAVPEMRAVLALFEGTVTGAADGYARIADRPAAVLLHLGPGLSNGLANLHNARRARVPMVVIVGDHATYHKQLDSPLESDIDALAATVSGWVRRTYNVEDVSADTVDAIAYARTHHDIATLILPADISWSEGALLAPSPAETTQQAVDTGPIELAAKVLQSDPSSVLLIGGDATGERGLLDAARVAEACGVRLFCEVFPTRLARGIGVPSVERLGYFAEGASAQLAGAQHLVLAGARAPVSFFAYPGRPSNLVPDGCEVHDLAGSVGAAAALAQLAELVAPGLVAQTSTRAGPTVPMDRLTAGSAATVIGASIPENAIVVDEANTAGVLLPQATAGAPRHDWLTLTGGAIGFGLPSAVGAAIAAPHRPVLSLQADGSAMYTISALWTQAREGLDVTTVIYHNSAYDILRLELLRVEATDGAAGPRARRLLELSEPTLDFVQMAAGMGVPGCRVTTTSDLAAALKTAFATRGPYLIEAIIPSSLDGIS